MTPYGLDVAGLTDQGVKRDHNEDAWSEPPSSLTKQRREAKGLLYIVADGVGGNQAGDVASAMAVDIIQQEYYAHDSSDVEAGLEAAIQAAHQAIAQEAAAKTEQYGMGTTVTAVVLREGQLTVANVGDSRTYLVREGQATQLTTDHTWVEEQVQIGIITRQEAARHPQRNIITRSLGGEQAPQVDVFEEQVGPGDSVLLCSDGLSNMVSASEIGDSVLHAKNAKASVHQLVELAKERGAPDNVTAVLLNIKPARGGCGRSFLAAGIIGGSAFVIAGLALSALGLLPAETPTPSPESTPRLVAPTATSLPTLRPTATPAPVPSDTPTATALPLDTSLPQPEPVLPEPDASLPADEAVLFSWNWDHELQGEWHFVFEIRSGPEMPPLLQEQLPLNQRGFTLSEPLAPGEYWWAVSLLGSNRRGEPVQRRLRVLSLTPTPNP